MQREMERGEEKYQVCKKGRRRRKTDSEPDSMPRLATHFFFRPGENEREKESKESDEPDSMPRLATRGHGRAWREVEKLEERKPRYKLRIVVGCNKGGNGSIGDSAGFSAGLHRGSVDAGSGCWRKQGSSTWRSQLGAATVGKATLGQHHQRSRQQQGHIGGGAKGDSEEWNGREMGESERRAQERAGQYAQVSERGQRIGGGRGDKRRGSG